MGQLASQNSKSRSLIGWGFYGTHTPSVIQRNLLEDPSWYTSYTPYQAEISQGRLEALLVYQTMVADLTGLPMSNASLLDEATAAAEALFLGYSITGKKKCFVHQGLFPQSVDVIRSTATFLGIEVIEGSSQTLLGLDPAELCAAVFQSPDKYGLLHSFQPSMEHLRGAGCLRVLGSDLLALCLANDAGSQGFNVCYGSSQRFGVPLGFGGPSAAFFAFERQLLRKVPGRVIGVSKDSHGAVAYRMALQTREQHIRREKATSNICTAQALLANIAAMYAVYHGPHGLRGIASRANEKAQRLAAELVRLGLKVKGYEQDFCHFFDTVCLEHTESHSIAAFL